MVEERVVEVERPAGATHTHTTVYSDAPRSGGGAGWVIAVILVLAVVAGIYLFSNMSNSSARKDNAVAAAADDVGKAATKIGNAAEDAASKATQ